MAPASWLPLGAVLAAAVTLGGCVDDLADKKADAVAGKPPDLARSLMDAANSAQAQHDALTASTYYRSVYSREPDNIEAAVGLMRSLRELGGLDEAKIVANRALQDKPDDPAVLAEAGKIRLATGQTGEAIKLLKQATAADGKDWKSLSALGLAYDRLGDFAAADASYEAALKVSPDNAAVLNNFALSLAMANDLGGARNLLQRAVLAHGADLRVRQNLALIYALSGNMAKAEELTRGDLPPAVASATLDYYRQLAAAAPPSR